MPWAGLFAGPAAWAANTQLNYALAPALCPDGKAIVLLVAVALAAIGLAAAWLSWQAWNRHGGPERQGGPHDGRPRNFLAGLGVLSGCLFAVVILAQGAAALVLDGCLR